MYFCIVLWELFFQFTVGMHFYRTLRGSFFKFKLGMYSWRGGGKFALEVYVCGSNFGSSFADC